VVSIWSPGREGEARVWLLPAAIRDLLAGHEPASLEGRLTSPALWSFQTCPLCHHHHHQQLIAGGPLRAAPSLRLARSLHAVLILAKNPFSQPSAKPKSQGWSQEAAEVFGYHRAEARGKEVGRTLGWAHKGILHVQDPHTVTSSVDAACLSAFQRRGQESWLSSQSWYPGIRVGRQGTAAGKARTEKPRPAKGSKEGLVLLVP